MNFQHTYTNEDGDCTKSLTTVYNYQISNIHSNMHIQPTEINRLFNFFFSKISVLKLQNILNAKTVKISFLIIKQIQMNMNNCC